MKKILVLGLAGLFGFSLNVSAQAEFPAINLSSGHNAQGSARYQALSGAVGAVGVDFSSVHQNPAGIALFRSGNKVSLTGSYGWHKGIASWGNQARESKERKFGFDEFSYLTSWQTNSGKTISIGFGILNNGRFVRSLNAVGTPSPNGGYSLADYSAALLNGQSRIISQNKIAGEGFGSGAPWVGTLGVLNYWTSYNDQGGGYQSDYAWSGADGIKNEGPQSVGLVTQEQGSATNYDFAVGFQASSSLHLGLSLTATNLNYSYRSSYAEGFRSVEEGNADIYGLSLDNAYNIDGYGVRLGLGAIWEPISGLRLGGSIYTPSYYTLNWTAHRATSTGLSPAYVADASREYQRNPGAIETTTPTSEIEALLRTPWRFGLSAAYVLGRTAIFSADYEYSNLGGTRLKETQDDRYYADSYEDRYTADNTAIKDDFGGQHTLRLGVEFNATKRLALRAGYRLTTKPVTVKQLDADMPSQEAYVSGTAVHYRLPGELTGVSLGFGYRLSPSWTLDVAYVNSVQNDKVYTFPAIRDAKIQTLVQPMSAIKDKQSQDRLVATLSYRF